MVKVAKSLKKIIIEKLGPAFLEKGFTYNKSVSQNGFFYIFARGGRNPVMSGIRNIRMGM